MVAAPQVARVDYSNGRIAFVYMTDIHETGDWTTFDKYSFDKNEILTDLERTIDIPSGLREEQSWTIRNNAAIKQKSTLRNSKTNEVVSSRDVWFPSPAVAARQQAFPFWRLIRDKRQEILSKGRACADEER